MFCGESFAEEKKEVIRGGEGKREKERKGFIFEVEVGGEPWRCLFRWMTFLG